MILGYLVLVQLTNKNKSNAQDNESHCGLQNRLLALTNTR